MSLLISDDARVRTIFLNRPERLNAFNGQLVADLDESLKASAHDSDISVVVLTGNGRAFSSGADLKELADHLNEARDDPPPSDTDDGSGELSMFEGLIDTLTEFPKPLIMAVNGLGVGFGMTILSFADLVFMSSEARLRCPFTALGAPPEAASTYLLPHLIGPQNAAWVLLSSEWVTAAHAQSMGLAWMICAPDDLLPTVRRHAEILAEKSGSILTTVKKLLNAPRRQEIAAAVERENAAMTQMLRGGLGNVSLDAFAPSDPTSE